MATKTKTVEPYKSGQSTNDHEKPFPVKVKSNMSKERMGGVQDGLHAALGRNMPMAPSDTHEWTQTTTVRPIGAHYEPRGEFGRVAKKHEPNSTYTYGPGSNRKGESALGKAMNRVGEKSGYKKGGRKSGGGGKGA